MNARQLVHCEARAQKAQSAAELWRTPKFKRKLKIKCEKESGHVQDKRIIWIFIHKLVNEAKIGSNKINQQKLIVDEFSSKLYNNSESYKLNAL